MPLLHPGHRPIVKSGDRSEDDPKAVLAARVSESYVALFGLAAVGWTM